MSLISIGSKYNILGSDSRYFVVTGGRGSGKSYSVNSFLLLLTYEVGHVILFTRYTLTSAHVSIIPEFIDKIETANLSHDFYITKDEIVNLKTGSKILFKGIKTSSGTQTANLKSLSGITTWVLDESEELVDEDVFDKIDFSIRDKSKQNRVILVLNPTTKEHFIYKKFFESKGVEPASNLIKGNTTYIHTTYLDNTEYLSESFLSQIENIKLNNPQKYNHVILGGWLDKAEGVVFTNWKLGKFEEVNPSIYGQDFGFSIDPTTLVQTSIDKSNKRIYIKELVYKAKLTTTEIFELNQRFTENKLIIADSAEPRLIHELRVRGNNIKETIKGAGSVSAGLALMQDYELIIDPDSTNIVKELNNYTWSDRKSDTPIDAFNHSIDAIRYAVYFQLHKLSKGNTILG
jgi:phage terminase large subunit